MKITIDISKKTENFEFVSSLYSYLNSVCEYYEVDGDSVILKTDYNLRPDLTNFLVEVSKMGADSILAESI